MGVETDWQYDTPTGFVPIALSTRALPTGLTTGTVIANVLNIPKGSTPLARPTDQYVVTGSDAAGWQLKAGVNPPTLPSTCKIFAYNQLQRFQMTP